MALPLGIVRAGAPRPQPEAAHAPPTQPVASSAGFSVARLLSWSCGAARPALERQAAAAEGPLSTVYIQEMVRGAERELYAGGTAPDKCDSEGDARRPKELYDAACRRGPWPADAPAGMRAAAERGFVGGAPPCVFTRCVRGVEDATTIILATAYQGRAPNSPRGGKRSCGPPSRPE